MYIHENRATRLIPESDLLYFGTGVGFVELRGGLGATYVKRYSKSAAFEKVR